MAITKKIVGIVQGKSKAGLPVYTLHTVSPFDDYFNSPENGRKCDGMKAESIYVGAYDCANLKVGQEIEIYFDQAIVANGKPFQNVAFINVKK